MYLSNIDGSQFKKLTIAFQELIDWKELVINNRVYFITFENTNKNGAFDKEEEVHYQYVDLNSENRMVTEYKPL